MIARGLCLPWAATRRVRGPMRLLPVSLRREVASAVGLTVALVTIITASVVVITTASAMLADRQRRAKQGVDVVADGVLAVGSSKIRRFERKEAVVRATFVEQPWAIAWVWARLTEPFARMDSCSSTQLGA